MRIFLIFFILSCFACSYSSTLIPNAPEKVIYFENTEYQLDVYLVRGVNPGKTIMIIGGIQGDEQAGFLVTDSYVDLKLFRGNLILVPRASLPTIIDDERQYRFDMNRRFNRPKTYFFEDKVVRVLEKYANKSDVLLNLHEGGGFYREVWVDELRNPYRYGQCIIADADRVLLNETKIIMDEVAIKICKDVNELISNKDHHFRFWNHDTLSPTSRHKEQRNSATFYALTNVFIPAYGLEVSTSLPFDKRITYMTYLVEAFIREYDIIPFYSNIRNDEPEFNFAIIKVNGEPQVFYDKSIIEIDAFTKINVEYISSNYCRGITVDIVGVGTRNDLERDFFISETTEIKIRKDWLVIGEISLSIKEDSVISRDFVYQGLKLEVDSEEFFLEPDQTLEIIEGSEIRILYAEPREMNAVINFVGFPHPVIFNKADDTYQPINTETDLLPRFAIDGSDLYEIYVQYNNKKIGFNYIKLNRKDFLGIFIKADDVEYFLRPDESLNVFKGTLLKILGPKPKSSKIISDFVGFPHPYLPTVSDNINFLIDTGNDLISDFSIDGGSTYEVITYKEGQVLALNRVFIEDPELYELELCNSQTFIFLENNDVYSIKKNEILTIRNIRSNLPNKEKVSIKTTSDFKGTLVFDGIEFDCVTESKGQKKPVHFYFNNYRFATVYFKFQ